MKRRVYDQFDENLLEREESPLKKKIVIRNKPNHDILPLFIMPDHRIIVFTQSPIYKRIYHHLKSICQPLYRPRLIHEYKITKFSLYTAMVLHYKAQQIVKILEKLSKNLVFPESLEMEINQYMQHAGKVRFSLINEEYFIFTTEEISLLIEEYIEKIEEVKVKQIYDYHLQEISQEVDMVVQGKKEEEQMDDPYPQDRDFQEEIEQRQAQEIKIGKEKQTTLIKYRIKGNYFEVTRRLVEKNIPIVQEFDFAHCKQLPNIEIDMNSDVQLRFYQESALKNVFIGGKARSGLIILPCGAGKSMVAIALIQRIKKKAIIFCENQTSAVQWKEQFIRWTTIQRNKVIILTSKYKETNLAHIESCSIFITTYSMVGLKRDRQNKFLAKTQQLSWGVCVADEVHKLPAETFQMVLQKYKFYLKIGLTATPYRQDKKIDNLYYMIGPKLYQQNWLDLVNEGCLAKPYCVQILCHMPPMFRQSYQNLNRAELIHTANPQKFKVLQYLIKKHTHFGDKILVFCDRPKILEKYAKLMKRPFIHGEVSEEERLHFYGAFKTIKQFNVLFLSRVGDTAIDLPCANVGIQIGMHYKSRRQQVQRMGRIMRPKDNPFNQFNAFFYTLVSQDTDEADFCRQRQKILIDQGFQHQIKMANEFDYTGVKVQQLDERQHLMFVLSEHEQGNKILRNDNLSRRAGTSVQERDMSGQLQYYYEQMDDD